MLSRVVPTPSVTMETAVPPFVFAVVGGGAGAEGATAPATMGEQSNIEQDAAARQPCSTP